MPKKLYFLVYFLLLTMSFTWGVPAVAEAEPKAIIDKTIFARRCEYSLNKNSVRKYDGEMGIRTRNKTLFNSKSDVLLPINSYIDKPTPVSALMDSSGNIVTFRVIIGKPRVSIDVDKYLNNRNVSWSLSPFIARGFLNIGSNRNVLIGIQNIFYDQLTMSVWDQFKGGLMITTGAKKAPLHPDLVINKEFGMSEVLVPFRKIKVVAMMSEERYFELLKFAQVTDNDISVHRLLEGIAQMPEFKPSLMDRLPL